MNEDRPMQSALNELDVDFDPRLEAWAEGTLSTEDEAQLLKDAEHDEELSSRLARLRPATEADIDRILNLAKAELTRNEAPPNNVIDLAKHKRWLWMPSAAAAAAAAIALVATKGGPTDPIHLEGLPADRIARFEAGQSVTVDLGPGAGDQKIAVWVRQGDTAVRLDEWWAPTETGGRRLQGPAEVLTQHRYGTVELYFQVGANIQEGPARLSSAQLAQLPGQVLKRQIEVGLPTYTLAQLDIERPERGAEDEAVPQTVELPENPQAKVRLRFEPKVSVASTIAAHAFVVAGEQVKALGPDTLVVKEGVVQLSTTAGALSIAKNPRLVLLFGLPQAKQSPPSNLENLARSAAPGFEAGWHRFVVDLRTP